MRHPLYAISNVWAPRLSTAAARSAEFFFTHLFRILRLRLSTLYTTIIDLYTDYYMCICYTNTPVYYTHTYARFSPTGRDAIVRPATTACVPRS